MRIAKLWGAGICMHEQYQAPLPVNSPALPEPFYYLHNFRAVLAWIGERYADLLDDQERAFIAAFAELPGASQALLVRMVMRKGTLFREGKLAYAEIGDTRAAVQPLLALGWVDAQPALELAQLFGLLKKDELSQLFRDHLGRANLRKDALLERLQPLFPRRGGSPSGRPTSPNRSTSCAAWRSATACG